MPPPVISAIGSTVGKAVIGSAVGGLVGRAIGGGPSRPQPVPGFFTDQERVNLFNQLNQPAQLPSISVQTIRPQSSVFFNPFMSDLNRVSAQIGALNAQAGRFDPQIFDQISRLRGQIGGLQERVRPGFSEIREARLSAVDRARQRTLSETRDNLARRGISGSSFGMGLVGSQELGFANQAAEQAAISTIEELQTNIQLIDLDRQLVETNIAGLAEQSRVKIAAAEAALGKAQITGQALSADVQSRQAAAIAEAEAQAANARLQLEDLRRRQSLFLELDELSLTNQRFASELAFRENQGRGEFIGQMIGTGANIGLAIPGRGTSSGAGGTVLSRPQIFANVEDAGLPRPSSAFTTQPFLPASTGSFVDFT